MQTVMNNIKSVDNKLSEQIKYLTQVSTGHPHEGSSYPSQKVLQSAWHRLEHVKTRISELDRLRQQASLTPAQKQALTQQHVKQQITQQQSQQQSGKILFFIFMIMEFHIQIDYWYCNYTQTICRNNKKT